MRLSRSQHVAVVSLSCVLFGCLTTGAQGFERNATELCTTINGYYGDLRGVPRLVAFEYTVALSNDTTEEEFVENILPELEVTMNDAVVPTLFNCVRKKNKEFRRHSLQEDVLSGLSARPHDIVSTNVTCEAENCLGLLGFVIFYFPSEEEVDMSVADLFYQTLSEAMDTGVFETDQILGTEYVADVTEEEIPPEIEIPPPPANWTIDETDAPTDAETEPPAVIEKSTDDVPVEIIAPVVAGGTLLLCALAYWAIRRRRARRSPSASKKWGDGEEKEPENQQQGAITNAEPMNVSIDDSVWYTAGDNDSSAASSSAQSTTSSRS